MSNLKCTKHEKGNFASKLILTGNFAFVLMLQSFWHLSAAAVCCKAASLFQ